MKALKTLLVIASVLAASAALATDRGSPQPGPSTAVAASQSTSASQSVSHSSAVGAAQSNAAGGSVNSGDAWAVALPGHASPSYAGMYSICVKGRGYFWNGFWSWDPDLECVKMIADLERLRAAPLPAKPVALLTEFPPEKTSAPGVVLASCDPPAKAKSVAAAKASGACKS